ncbi:MAG: cyclopentanol dehydrogenase [SAR202 cluster bacterium Io17-Chloro-G9]|nr:MAG: cyclopentanol dehydrogenase [SAR202 cluster bacterium Io17-Chloro-G9]
MGRLDGKVALISGGARGQGAAEAKLFAQEGAKVVIGDVLDEAGMKVEAEIRELGGEATYVHLDVTREEDWISAVRAAVDRHGKLDVLVNNAGIGSAGTGGVQTGIEDAPEEAWDQVLDVNAKGVFLGTKSAIPEMRKAGSGSIINISSIAGIVALGRSSGAYAASKGAVRLLTKSTAVQYAKEGIRCNSVHPGWIDTPMTERSLSVPENREDRINRTPLGRIGTTADIAYGVLFLASNESSFVTGSELVIDGGFTAQ